MDRQDLSLIILYLSVILLMNYLILNRVKQLAPELK
jgi:hypothetical protein